MGRPKLKPEERKQTFTIRLEPENKRWIDEIRGEGYAPQKIINLAIEKFRGEFDGEYMWIKKTC